MISIDLPWPPSVNAYWRSPNKGPLAGRTLISEAGREYRKAVSHAVRDQAPENIGDDRCAVDIEVRMPDKRRRDLDNLPKAVLDALTYAKVWQDDSQIDDLRVWRSDRIGGIVVVRIRSLELPQGCLVDPQLERVF